MLQLYKMGKKQRDPQKIERKIIAREKIDENKGKVSQAQFNKFLSTMKEEGQTEKILERLKVMNMKTSP
jgi:hypothetical protein